MSIWPCYDVQSHGILYITVSLMNRPMFARIKRSQKVMLLSKTEFRTLNQSSWSTHRKLSKSRTNGPRYMRYVEYLPIVFILQTYFGLALKLYSGPKRLGYSRPGSFITYAVLVRLGVAMWEPNDPPQRIPILPLPLATRTIPSVARALVGVQEAK